MSRESVARANSILHRSGQVIEIRAMFRDGRIMTGSLHDVKQVHEWIQSASDDEGVQRVTWSVQNIRPDWQVQGDLNFGRKALTKSDVASRNFIFVDVDADRPEGESNATDVELNAAWSQVMEIVRWSTWTQGIAKPFITC